MLALSIWLGGGPASADVQVNSADNASPTLGNHTSESEPAVARHGSLAVIGYNSTRQVGLLGMGFSMSRLGFAYSNDAGATYIDGGFLPSGGAYLMADPSLAFDANGTLYYAALVTAATTGYSYVGVSQSTMTEPALAFADPVLISGPFSTNNGLEDKELLAVDTTGGAYNGRVYVGWTDFDSTFGGNSQVEFAASTSTAPLAFGPTIALSPRGIPLLTGVVPAVAPNGNVYVAWLTSLSTTSAGSATINMLESTDGGSTFVNPNPSDPSPIQTVASFISTENDLTTHTKIRSRSVPLLAIDNTPVGSATRGNLYLVFQAQPDSTGTPRSEIYFTESTNGGQSWSPPRNISSGPAATVGQDFTANDNFLPAISVSPVSGHIKVLFFSRRGDPANEDIQVYEAGSTDAGMTWYNRTYSAVAFAPSTGYDSVLQPDYMGDYQSAFSDASGLLGAWTDTRNACTPPSQASAPCSPAGRGDQDVWSNAEADAIGADLAITPWGYVTGVGPTWSTPDIFVVDSANVAVNAQLGVNNNLRARVRNLGSANATNAVVRFSFAPWYASIPDSAFELIGTVPLNLAAGATQIVPIDWNLTNLSDTNGGIWPGPISEFGHFCVRVDIEYPPDINMSNNTAQSNFLDVTTAPGGEPRMPIRFILGNPLAREAKLQLRVEDLPPELRSTVEPLTIEVPGKAFFRKTPAGSSMLFHPRELQTGTIALPLPPPSVTRHLEHDIVVNIDSIVEGKIVGGFSVRLARANVPAPKSVKPAMRRVVSSVVAHSVQPVESTPEIFALTSARPVERVRQTIGAYLTSRKISIDQDVPERGLISSNAIPLGNAALLAAVPKQARSLVPNGAFGRYFVSFRTVRDDRLLGDASRVELSIRIVVLGSGDLEDQSEGRIVPSNGSLERRFVDELAPQLK